MGLTAPVPVNAEGKLAVHLFFLQVTESKTCWQCLLLQFIQRISSDWHSVDGYFSWAYAIVTKIPST